MQGQINVQGGKMLNLNNRVLCYARTVYFGWICSYQRKTQPEKFGFPPCISHINVSKYRIICKSYGGRLHGGPGRGWGLKILRIFWIVSFIWQDIQKMKKNVGFSVNTSFLKIMREEDIFKSPHCNEVKFDDLQFTLNKILLRETLKKFLANTFTLPWIPFAFKLVSY